MTGPEHYKRAEALLVEAERDLLAGTTSGNWQEHDALVERAKVHATLAQAAATIDQRERRAIPLGDWAKVIW